jgi:hypothetical protein
MLVSRFESLETHEQDNCASPTRQRHLRGSHQVILPPSNMPPLLLPSFRRQQRVIDFTALEQTCPEGIYISLLPDNPAHWSGVNFVRSGQSDLTLSAPLL